MRASLSVCLAMAVLVGACSARAQALESTCQKELLAGAAPTSNRKRDITGDDLLRLRDIGRPSEQQGSDPIISVSPDGEKVAFQMRRADPDRNAYCLGVFVLDLAAAGSPRLLDEGGELIRTVRRTEKVAMTPAGDAQLLVPRWSPDSAKLAYLRRDGGVTQAWRVDIQTGDAQPATRLGSDVEAVGWSGSSLVVSSRRASDIEERRIDEEGRSGYLYDDRFVPLYGPRPAAPGGQVLKYFALEDGSTAERAANKREELAVKSATGFETPADALLFTALDPEHRAWTFTLPATERVATGSTDPTRLYAMAGLRIETPGWNLNCRLPVCDGVTGLWLDATGERLLFLRREGWRGTRATLYEWRAKARTPRAITSTSDNIVGCDLAKAGLVCGQESANQPRRLVLFDIHDGRMSVLFDPNPEFAALRLGEVRRLEWKNSLGFEAFGSLVVPPGYKSKQHLPLVIVQYQNRGFLRGGTGDEYPIHVMAAHGIAVLAVDRPISYGYAKDGRAITGDGAVALNRRNNANRADQWSTLDSLRAGLEKVFALNLIDPKRVGITGLSNGSTSAQFAMLNSDLIAAGALSGCCDDEFVAPVSGLSGAEYMEQTGRPLVATTDAKFYKDVSLAQHAEAFNTPLLIQAADTEYLYALPAVTTLKLRRKPVEMFVYPNEFHVKWQPAHRLAVYNRNVDWFNYWLQCKTDPDPSKAEQYARWDKLRGATDTRACSKG